MHMRRQLLAATLAAAITGIGFATAPSASATILPCYNVSNAMSLVRYANGSSQCFVWNGTIGPSSSGNYLLVNDWYDEVDSGIYNLTVSWHDTKTGAWFPEPVAPEEKVHQPTDYSILYSVTFNS